MSRASSRPAMTSIGKPSAASALGRNWAMFFATRKVLVATARTCSGAKPRNRSPNWARHSKARVWLSSSRFLLASKPPAKRTICLMFSTSCGCPLLFWQICRRKLLEPKSTEARREAQFSMGGGPCERGWGLGVSVGSLKTGERRFQAAYFVSAYLVSIVSSTISATLSALCGMASVRARLAHARHCSRVKPPMIWASFCAVSCDWGSSKPASAATM